MHGSHSEIVSNTKVVNFDPIHPVIREKFLKFLFFLATGGMFCYLVKIEQHPSSQQFYFFLAIID